MPFLLIKLTREKWVKEGELQADALGDLRTQENSLSIWEIGDDKENLERVATTLATNLGLPPDYTLLNSETLEALGFEFDVRPGNWLMIKLSAPKLLKLSSLIQSSLE